MGASGCKNESKISTEEYCEDYFVPNQSQIILELIIWNKTITFMTLNVRSKDLLT